MLLPAIRERISRLSRIHKILFSILLISIFIISTEAVYYFWLTKWRVSEWDSVNKEAIYEEGPFLYLKTDESREEPVAIWGRVTRIEGLTLTIEKGGQKVTVLMNEEFGFAKVNKPELRVLMPDIFTGLTGMDTPAVMEIKMQLREEMVEKGLLVVAEQVNIEDLSKLIAVGDFVKILSVGSGVDTMKRGNVLVLLEYLKS